MVVRVLLVVLLVGGGLAAGSQLVRRVADPQAALPALPTTVPITVAPANSWPDDIADLVAFVERERGRPFVAPVVIEFVDPAVYDAGAEQHPEPLQRPLTVEEFRQVLDALQLPVVDPAPIDDGGVRFEPVRRTIRVRGDDLEPSMRTAAVGALTRAWLDQHASFPSNVDARAIFAGEVARVQDAFVAAEPGATPRRPEQVSVDQYDAKMPLIVARGELARVGRVVVDRQFTLAGTGGVDALLDGAGEPDALIAPWGSPTQPVDPIMMLPQAPAGSTGVEFPRVMGPYELLLILDAWLPWSQVRPAIDGLSQATYSSHVPAGGGAVCVEITARFVSDRQPFLDVVSAWAFASGSVATPVVDPDGTVVVSSCADGSSLAPPPAPISTARAVAVEAALVGLLPDASSVAVAQVLCAARAVIDDPGAGPSLAGGAPDESLLAAALQGALVSCGAAPDLVPATDISWMYQR